MVPKIKYAFLGYNSIMCTLKIRLHVNHKNFDFGDNRIQFFFFIFAFPSVHRIFLKIFNFFASSFID